MKRLIVAVLAAVALAGALISPASSAPKPASEYFVDRDALPFEALDGATAYFGVLGQAGYRIEVPDDWNGDLVLWAHGYRGQGAELTVDNHPLREFLIGSGYAWAASSYSKNDYNVLDPARDTRRLAGNFNRLTRRGNPEHRYLHGVSMGGNITAYSAERYGTYYDGTMPLCGVLADTENFNYYADLNLAAQALGGAGSFPIDPTAWVTADVPTIRANFGATPESFPLALSESGEQWKAVLEDLSGGERPNFDEAFAFWNSTDPENPFDTGFLFGLGIDTGTVAITGDYLNTADTVYQLDSDPEVSAAEEALNESVQRIDSPPASPKNRRGVPENTGAITAPMLTMHNLGDLFVPFVHEQIYAERVGAQGRSDLLVQRALRGVGHCDFTGPELVAAHLDLVNWVENGVKPEGDPMLDRDAVADPAYGCRFTVGDHFLATPCPEDEPS